MQIIIRPERKEDYNAIKTLNGLAFKQENEGILIEKIRQNSKYIPELSLIAELDDKIVGHILFFPVKIKNYDSEFDSVSLAPMAVLPEFQNKGIGGQLIRKGLNVCKDMGYKSAVVLGHPEYYPKFGFQKASKWKIKLPFEGAPDEASMAIELVKDGLKDITGIIQYPEEYNEAL